MKALGNTAYQSRNFERAIELYTRAINVSPKPEPVFYSNRAACKSRNPHNLVYRIPGLSSEAGYINLSPPKLDLVVEDCSEALKLNPDYVKALNRRATALEQLKQYEYALRGMFSLTIPCGGASLVDGFSGFVNPRLYRCDNFG